MSKTTHGRMAGAEVNREETNGAKTVFRPAQLAADEVLRLM
jgi:hypothetical protein